MKILKILECVPNFSEGRRKEVIDAITNAAKGVKGVTLLDSESDANHNRMVLTFVGEPESVKQAALESSAVAVKMIDLTKHRGEHPRMGAVDVVPFVPLRETTLQECVEIANEFGQEFSKKFEVPVFLYESAAKIPERRDLAKVREGQFEGLRDLIGKDPKRVPDYGPRTMHPTAGATAVGARPILIAYNINLRTTDVSIARKIAHRIRERDGGLPSVKALGFELRDKQMVQVSMNLTDFAVTSIPEVFEKISNIANEFKISVVESEIVGLVPLAALVGAAKAHLQLSNFTSKQIIENRLLDLVSGDSANREDFSKLPLAEFASKVASKDPTPGGGTASAYVGVLSASLVAMVCRLTIGKKGYESLDERMTMIMKVAEDCSSKLMELANQDSVAYLKVAKALKLPKNGEREKSLRKAAVNNALKEAALVPSETMSTAIKVLELAREVMKEGNKSAFSDAQTASDLARAAARGAWINVKTNLDSLSEEGDFASNLTKKLEPLLPEIG